jgi:hypothetical protein
MDYGRTCFVDRHWIDTGVGGPVATKGFWWRPDTDDLAPNAGEVAWPYWRDPAAPMEDGSTDWTFRPFYTDGNFWQGLRLAFGGFLEPCGVVMASGTTELTGSKSVQTCCRVANPPWGFTVEVSGVTGAGCATVNGTYTFGWDPGGVAAPCGWFGQDLTRVDYGGYFDYQATGGFWVLEVGGLGNFIAVEFGDSALDWSGPFDLVWTSDVGSCSAAGATIRITPMAHFPTCQPEGLTDESGDQIDTEAGNDLTTEN